MPVIGGRSALGSDREENASMKEKKYSRLKQLIVEDRILLLPHKKFRGIRQAYVYSRCGMSLKYFEKAYDRGDVVLEVVASGIRVGSPLSWEDAVDEHGQSVGTPSRS